MSDLAVSHCKRFLVTAMRRGTILGAALLACVSCPARAGDSPAPRSVEIRSVRVGLANRFKVGYWTPVWVTLAAGDAHVQGRLELIAPDGDGIPAAFQPGGAPEVTIAANREQTVLQYVKFGRLREDLTVRLVDSQQPPVTLAQRVFGRRELPIPLSATDDWIVQIGPSIGLEEAVKKRMRSHSRRIEIGQITTAAELPTQWYGYEGLNTLVVATSQVCLLEQLDDVRFAACERWVQMGGRLILCVGARGRDVFAPGSRLARLAPGAEAAVIALRQTTGLENYAGATERLDEAGGERARRFSLSLTTFPQVRGWVENSEIGGPRGRLPTIIRYPYGFGQIVFVGVDLDQPPFVKWQGRTGLVVKLLQEDPQSRREDVSRQSNPRQMSHLGFDDLVGQLRASLDQFQGVTRVEFSWIAGLLVAYLLLIGPADYLLLKKLKRTHWTWLTFPATVGAFCILAYVLADRWRGTQVHLNQVEVIDVDVESSLARGSCWAHLYSPSTQTFQLDLQTQWPYDSDAAQHAGQLLAWQGLPGRGLGGLDTTNSAASFTQSYRVQYDQASELSGLPIEVSGSKSLSARWWAEVPLARPPRLETDSNGLLRGELANPLDVALTDTMIIYENWMYAQTGTWRPGQTINFEGRSPRNLQWRLARRRVVESKDVTTPWDRSAFDVPRIMEVMMFYKAAGGESYTELTHRYQAYLDLSDHLRTGRAIILGRGPATAGRFRRGGEPLVGEADPPLTFYRVVVPVDKS